MDSPTMEMPCACDCGEWFELNKGYKSQYSDKVVCPGCHERELDELEVLEENHKNYD